MLIKPKKICMVIDSWDPLIGGAQQHIKELSRRLVTDYGCEVHLVTRNILLKGKPWMPRNEIFMDGKFTVHRVGVPSGFKNIFARLSWCVFAGFFIRRLHIKEHFDLIHAHAFLSSYPARFARFLCGLPVIYSIHGTSLFHKKSGLSAKVESDLLTKIKYDQEITVAENFLKLKNVNKHVVVIPNGVDVSVYDKVEVEKPNDGILRILYVGRFDPIKGVPVLLKGIHALTKDGYKKEIEVHLVGYGYEIEKLRKIVRELHLTRIVKFLGRLEGEDLIKEYKSCDVFVLPSYSEGQSLTLMEACACGLPILATQVGDNDKLVKENVNGFLVQPGSHIEIKQYLEMMIENPHLKRMGEASRIILSESGLTWDNCAQKTFDVYSRVYMRLKGVPAITKWRDLLREPRLPHRFWGQAMRHLSMTKMAIRKITIDEPILCSITVDVENNFGSNNDDGDIRPTLHTCGKFFDSFKNFSEQQEFKSTLFVQGDLVPHLADTLKSFEASGHEIGVHELWSGVKWFLDDRPTTRSEKALFLDQILKNFSEAGLRKPLSFRAPNMSASHETIKMLSEFGFKYDSSFASHRGRDFGMTAPLPYEVCGIKGVPVSFDPLPHFQRRALVVPVSLYWVLNLYYLVNLKDEELEDVIMRILLVQKRHNVKPHLVFLMHSWEFESSDLSSYCGGENYTKLAMKLYNLREKFKLKFTTFESLVTNIICT